MEEEAPAIGIDLGTTYSCAAVVVNDDIKIIHGEDGSNIMASCVLFKDTGERVIGNFARETSIRNYNSCVYGVKRIIGRSYEDYTSLKDSIFYPFEVKNKQGKAIVSVEQNKEEKCFAPEEISAMVLSKLKERAEEVLRKKVTKAVITIPAHFSGAQRSATKHAGQIAGLEILRVLNEPTAAALAYELDSKYKNRECNILVYDFGGGTFDVSVLKILDCTIYVKATNGEPFLGGDDIDKRLTDYFIKEFKTKNNIDVSSNKTAVRRLMQKAEKAKILLCNVENVDIDIDYLHQDLHFSTSLTRSNFLELNTDLFDKTLDCVQKTLKDANTTKYHIDEIVLIGGTTRIPYIKAMIKKYFNKEPNASIHPDQAVAIGAAKLAAKIENSNSKKVKSLKLFDICSLSLGIECKGDIMNVLIPRNTTIPASNTQSYTLDEDQKDVRITIYEGEMPFVTDNIKLGEIILNNLKSTTKNSVINVTFNLNEDGILNVQAEEENGDSKEELKVQMIQNQLSTEEIEEMLTQAKRIEKDIKIKATELKKYLFAVTHNEL